MVLANFAATKVARTPWRQAEKDKHVDASKAKTLDSGSPLRGVRNDEPDNGFR
jgi:hypothetical protein